jgi:hypothetical protein
VGFLAACYHFFDTTSITKSKFEFISKDVMIYRGLTASGKSQKSPDHFTMVSKMVRQGGQAWPVSCHANRLHVVLIPAIAERADYVLYALAIVAHFLAPFVRMSRPQPSFLLQLAGLPARRAGGSPWISCICSRAITPPG